MIQMVFAVALLFSAWAAWRRSPLYSARATLRTAGVVLLAIVGAGLLVWAAVTLTEGRSFAFTMTVMGIVVLIDTWTLIFGIILYTTPREARPVPRPGAVMVTTNRRVARRWMVRLAIVVGAMLGLGAVLRGVAQILLLVFGGFAAFLGVMLMPVLYWSRRNADLAESAVESDPWVRWTYGAGEWTAWARVQRSRLDGTPVNPLPKNFGWRMAGAMVLLAVGVFVFCPGSALWRAGYVAVVGVMLWLIVWFSRRSERGAGAALERRMLASAAEAVFGESGLVANGAFTPWLNADTWLVSAERDEREPRSLCFHFVRQIVNPYGGPQELRIDQAVLLPEGAGDDVERLAAELRARCPKARVAIE